MRIALIVPVTLTLWKGELFLALLFLVLAAMTDLLDGFLARQFEWRTILGSWLDPAADKLLIATVLFTQTAKGAVPIWFCAITLFRDIGLTAALLSFLAAGKRIRIAPHLTGKLATFLQTVALVMSILQSMYAWGKGLVLPLCVLSAASTLLSSFLYARAAVRSKF